MIHVVARMELKNGCYEKMLDVMKELVPVVRAEDGCIAYVPCSDINGDEKDKYLTIVEAWESEAHLKAHLDSPHMAKFREVAQELRSGSVVKVLKPEL